MHDEELVRPFITHHIGVDHSIRMMGDKPWLFFRHPDGQWVSECPVSGPGLSWRGNARINMQGRNAVTNVATRSWTELAETQEPQKCECKFPDTLPRVHPPTCSGTGLVYVFPDESKVRERCEPCKGKGAGWVGKYDAPQVMAHPVCEGRGWTASQNLATWLDALVVARFNHGKIMRIMIDAITCGQSSGPAFRAAVTAALNQREGIRWPG